MPVSVRNVRAKWRGESRARAARASTDRSPPGCSVIQCWTARNGSRRAVWAVSWALNWAWFPGLRRKTTRCRATVSATSRPWSSSTSASARSIPAVTPAEVAGLPSRTKIGSGSTSTAGKVRARWSQTVQCVVTRCPSSCPAAASSRAPVQTETSRSECGACSRSQSTRAGSGARVPSPPGTRRVWAGPAYARLLSGTSVRPLDDRTGAPSSEALRSSYETSGNREAPAKTSIGPLTSRLWMPSKRTTSTDRCFMLPSWAATRRAAMTGSPPFLPWRAATHFTVARSSGPYRPVGSVRV